ncbi:hypothetical protein COLO4_10005 [Corchorus olitorius]|uniref:Uncharacterized protein n=1 Tax=Corchorus olitorius TaxID=93759 RepID=A0A1R3KAD7_9ROSI|nr:hypothetical protein COLO4_10005 [Corchorus olitorius]
MFEQKVHTLKGEKAVRRGKICFFSDSAEFVEIKSRRELMCTCGR